MTRSPAPLQGVRVLDFGHTIAIDQDPEARHAVTRELGAFKTSMLLDAERGRPIELDAIVTAVPTPNIDALLGLTRLFARGRGLYPSS